VMELLTKELIGVQDVRHDDALAGLNFRANH